MEKTPEPQGNRPLCTHETQGENLICSISQTYLAALRNSSESRLQQAVEPLRYLLNSTLQTSSNRVCKGFLGSGFQDGHKDVKPGDREAIEKAANSTEEGKEEEKKCIHLSPNRKTGLQ